LPSNRKCGKKRPHMKIEHDKIHKFISKDLSFRVAVAMGSDVVREMQSIQNTYPLATMAVGRSMMAAALMASHLKEEQLVSLYFRGDGPMEMFFAEATHEGHVRGYTPNPHLAQTADDPLALGAAIGKGLLTVVHSHPQQNSPQRGTVEIQTGEVGEDVAFYLLQSHQVRSLVSLGVKVNPYGLVQGAGGIIIELLPGYSETTVATLEQNFKSTRSISEMITAGGGVDEILADYCKGIPILPLEHPYSMSYQCRCSKERLGNALVLLGHMEIEKMIQEKQPAEARCEFCGRGYTIEIGELQDLLEKLRSGPPH
jgi:molecular chaperone Hsp33